MTIIAAADGSALGNPGPAGWGWYVDESCWASGGWAHGTNNMGELTAVLDLLQQSAHLSEDLVVYCDSTYVINSITKWMPGWKRRGWKKGDGKPVLNVEIMKALDAAMAGRKVRFEWVKGHTGHVLNEEADRLANAAALAWKEGRRPDPGPGFTGAQVVLHPEARPGQVVQEPDLFSALAEDAADEGRSPRASDEERVTALERSLLTDAVRSNRAAVAELLHPEWTEVGSSGRVWTRAEMLERMAPVGKVDMEVLDLARLAPDVILLVWRAGRGGVCTLRSSVWVRSASGWQQRFHQGTPEP